MSGVHKHPTISFRVSDREREMIEAKILASGMQKKDYFVRSCIYNRICVVGKKEVIYQLVEELQNMQTDILSMVLSTRMMFHFTRKLLILAELRNSLMRGKKEEHTR
jgi:hypothetical protein